MKNRDEIICGVHAVLEAIRAGKRKIFQVYVVEGKQDKTVRDLGDAARSAGLVVTAIPNGELFRLSHMEKHQGVAARVEPFHYTSEDDILSQIPKNPFFLILDQITDPQNMGGILRSAHLCGVDAVFLPKDHAAGVGPAVARASAGAVEYLPVVQVTNLVNLINTLKEKGIWIVGADGDTPQSVYDYDAAGPVALVMGSEGRGLRPLVKSNCDHCVHIPMTGQIGSFNVSVAGGILMAEFHRQRLQKLREST